MNTVNIQKHRSVTKKGTHFVINDVINTINQCESFLNIIHHYLQRCMDNLVKISIPTLDKYEYISTCNEIRYFVREIDNIVQSAQFNTRKILVSTKDTDSSKEIVFNILPFGYTFVFEVPIIDSIALGLEKYKIDWNYKHTTIDALVATCPDNINRSDSVVLKSTYSFVNDLIGTGSVYSNYGIDLNNVTSAILKLNDSFEFNDYNCISIIDNNNSTFSEFKFDKNTLYLTYIAQNTNAQVDFCSSDLDTYVFPFVIGTTVKEQEDFINENIYKFKSTFAKALNLVELELEKMIHYRNILVPTNSKILNIHYNGSKRYIENRCDTNFIKINRTNLKRKYKNKKKYKDREMKEFEPGFVELYGYSKGLLPDYLPSEINENIILNIEQLESTNRKKTYNKENFVEIIYNNTSFIKFSYDSTSFENEKFIPLNL